MNLSRFGRTPSKQGGIFAEFIQAVLNILLPLLIKGISQKAAGRLKQLFQTACGLFTAALGNAR